jgi:acyl-coenzyme A synthetase/AMP-(fatty) acid ligase
MSRPRAIPRTIALLERSRDEVFARRKGRDISVATFLAHVAALRDALPSESHIFNLLRDRYEFTVAFAAIVAAGKCNVLPASPKPAVLRRLAEQLPPAGMIHDGLEPVAGITALAFPELSEQAPGEHDPAAGLHEAIPLLDAHQLGALTFTSGSSGIAKPVRKPLHTLRGAAAIYEDTLLPRGGNVVATVPAQHMYGLELGSLQAFWSPVSFSAGKPLFPADVQSELAGLPDNRVLVTTPLHLRALVESGLVFPPLERILCATAPLDAALARRAEQVLGAPVVDVYGCSEAGCLATRRLAETEAWTPLPGFRFSDQAPGALPPGSVPAPPRSCVDAAHLDETVTLGDQLLPMEAGRFRLAGRLGDMINVAGKRGSLGEITRLILEVPGVEDAAALLPDPPSDKQRPAALYVGTADAASIRRKLGEVLDPVFIPRPLLRVDALPRTAASKLPREALLACFEQHRRRR